MDERDDCLANARQCRAEAERASSPKVKVHYLRLAERWERLANERDEGVIGKPEPENNHSGASGR